MTSATPLVRLSTPAELVALVPHLCGFVPQASLVLVALRGPRRRVGLTIRLDLPDAHGPGAAAGAGGPAGAAAGAGAGAGAAAGARAGVAAALAARVAQDRARQALLVVYSEHGDQELLVRDIERALDEVDVVLDDALLVRAGRWSSYFCSDERCCPPAGTPVEEAPTPALTLVGAAQVLTGRAVLASRDELVAALAPPQLLAAVRCEQALERAADDLTRDVVDRGRDVVGRERQAAWRTAVEAAADPRVVVDGDAAARLVVALQDVLVRDAVLTWAIGQPDEVERLAGQLAASAVAPWDVPVCTLLAVVAWLRGDGALANVALDRALAGEPGYGLAVLVRSGLDGQVPPEQVRRWLKAASCAG